MASPSSPLTPLSRRRSAWLLLASLITEAPLVPYLPTWLTAIAVGVLAWRAWILVRTIPLPPRWLLSGLALACTVGVGIYFHTIFGKDAGVALLVVFLAFKLLETRTARDALAVVFLAYFLVLARFFYAQTMGAAVIMATEVLVITAALVNLSHERRPPAATLRIAGLLLAQATPFMLLLFVLFPRISGPLWGLPADAYAGVSGLSDSMSPGSISRLIQSDAIAFRVKFDGMPPARDTLYWRGPVLTRFDGRTWRASRSTAATALPYPTAGGGIGYEVTLEPQNRPWLFALELPSILPADGLVTPDYQLLAKDAIRSRYRYRLRSEPGIAVGADEHRQRLEEALRLPAQGNPRARQLALQLRAQAGSDAAAANAMLAYFRRQPFVYTLNPPLLGEDAVDDFLFRTRRGFCEHYAGSFVFVMRAAGIPARVVTGYQGGDVNPVDGYLEVRQLDAHAWAEIWLPGRGWRRVDPTASIAPNRIELNLAAAIPAGEALPFLVRAEFSWLRELRYRWDALSNGWNQWVLGYSPQRQRDLLRNLGMASPDWQAMTALLAGFCGALMLAYSAWAIRQRQPRDPVLAEWNRLHRKLRRRGLARQPWEGPRDYAARVAAALPGRGEDIEAIAALYETLRYCPSHDATALQELRRRVAAFVT